MPRANRCARDGTPFLRVALRDPTIGLRLGEVRLLGNRNGPNARHKAWKRNERRTTTDHIVAAHIRPSGGASFATAVDHLNLPVPKTSGASTGENTLSAPGEKPTSYSLTIYSYEDTSIASMPNDSRRFSRQVLIVFARRLRRCDMPSRNISTTSRNFIVTK